MSYGNIKELIPQRDPVMMVDRLVEVKGDRAVTSLTVRAGNYFLDGNDRLAEIGLLEHIAQSASAVAGHWAMAAGAGMPPVGYIGEVRKFNCYFLPKVGDELCTTITVGAEVAGVTLITGETRISNAVAADTQMKIYISND